MASTSSSSDCGPVKKKRRREVSVANSSDSPSKVVANINDALPDEILMEVLSFCSLTELLDIRNVCGHWSAVIGQMFAPKKEIVMPKAFIYFNSKVEDYILTPDGFETALSLCPALSVLDMTKVMDFFPQQLRFVESITTHCKQLAVLKLSDDCECTDFTIDESVALAQGLPCLEEFSAPGCPRLTDAFVFALFDSCKHLRVLDVSGSYNITSAPYVNTPVDMEKLCIYWSDTVGANVFGVVFKRCGDKLNHLGLSCGFRQDTEHLPDCIPYISQFSNLQKFVFKGHESKPTCTGESVFKPLGRLGKLRSLILDALECLHDEDIKEIVDGCPELENLTIKSVGTGGIESPCLQQLTADGFMYIANAKKLVKLAVCGLDHINGKCVKKFVTNLPRLRELDASCNITNIATKFLARHGLALTKLVIDGNKRLCNLSVLEEFVESSKKRDPDQVLHLYFEGTKLAANYHRLSTRRKRRFENIHNLKLYPGDNSYHSYGWKGVLL